METAELKFLLALGMTEGIGPALARHLIAQCGSAEAVFSEKKDTLCKISGIGTVSANNIKQFRDFGKAEAEIRLCLEKSIRMLAFTDSDYPYRLRECDDGPLLLFSKGQAGLNKKKLVAVVGTRTCTAYGRQFTEEFIAALANSGVTVVSGLASGTDTNAHRASLAHGLETVAVLGNGFGTVFPSVNRQLTAEIADKGRLLTEYLFHTPALKENFPKRNRIVAGISDAVVVVESGSRGGSLITASLANGYNRDVYALPGKHGDPQSQGCNRLIHKHQAALIYNIPELMLQLGFSQKNETAVQRPPADLFNGLTEEEYRICSLLYQKDLGIDTLYELSGLDINRLSFVLISLEFRNLIQVLPGKVYTLLI